MRTVFILCSYRRARAFDRRGGPRLGWCKAARASDLGRQVQRHGGCGVARLPGESPGRSEIARPLALHGRTCRCGSPRALHAVRHVSVACCARLPWRLIDSSTIAACFFSKLALNIWPHRATCTVQHATCTVRRCIALRNMHRAALQAPCGGGTWPSFSCVCLKSSWSFQFAACPTVRTACDRRLSVPCTDKGA